MIFDRSYHLISRRGHMRFRLFNAPVVFLNHSSRRRSKITRIAALTSRAERQLVTLKRAVRRDGIICRLRIDDATVRVDIYWKPPRYRRNLARFVSAMPLALIIDLRRAGFASLGAESVPIAGLSEAGILWASLVSGEAHVEQLGRSILASYGLANSDRAVVWASRSPKRAPRTKAPPLCEGPLSAHSGSLAA
jgi:hypothetical protein